MVNFDYSYSAFLVVVDFHTLVAVTTSHGALITQEHSLIQLQFWVQHIAQGHLGKMLNMAC